ncbi:MAG: PEP-CTERM sorting domain-containing protein [Chthoniobacterales bacterium]
MKTFLQSSAFTLLSLACLPLGNTLQSAVVTSIDFETSEGYSITGGAGGTANIVGQPGGANSWASQANNLGQGLVSTTQAHSGSQSLELDWGTGRARVTKVFDAPIPTAATQVEVSMAFRMGANSAFNASPITIYDSSDTPFAQISFQNSGASNAIGVATALGTYTSSGTNWVSNTWYELSLLFDLAADTFQVAIDGGAYSTSYDVKQLITGSPDYDVTTTSFYSMQVQGSNAAAATANAWFDNFQVSAIPEPGTATLLLGGLAVMSILRRRKTA